ncbi:hypothetical protein MBLNU230_g2368t1 [Neophaeotheca triangularis]
MADKQPTRAEALMQRFYTAENKYMSSPPETRDINSILAVVSTHFTLHQSPDLPYGGVYTGHSGMAAWYEEFVNDFNRVDVTDVRILERGDEVVVLSHLTLRVRKTGEELSWPLVQHARVDWREEKLVEMRPFYWNVRLFNEALGRAKYGG